MPFYPLGAELLGMIRQERDAAALRDRVAKLFEELRDDVYRYLLTLGLHPPRAQEAAQEVFLRLYQTLRKGEKLENPRAWVFRVAHNLGLKIRARQNSEEPLAPEWGEQNAGPSGNPESELLERERMTRFHSAVQGLSEQQRRCLFLRMEGLRYPEIGSALGISASTVGEFLRGPDFRISQAF